MALAASAVSQVAFGFVSPVLFWSVLSLGVAWSLRRRDPGRSGRDLLAGWAGMVGLLLAIHLVRFGADAVAPAALTINSALVFQLVLLAYLLRRRPRTRDDEAPAASDEPFEIQESLANSQPG